MPRFFNPPDIVKPFSRYSHGALVEGPARWLHISGQVGARPDGTIEQGFEAQAKRSWSNLLAVLKAGGMEPGDLVKVNVFLTRASDVARIAPIPRRGTRRRRARLDPAGHLGSGAIPIS